MASLVPVHANTDVMYAPSSILRSASQRLDNPLTSKGGLSEDIVRCLTKRDTNRVVCKIKVAMYSVCSRSVLSRAPPSFTTQKSGSVQRPIISLQMFTRRPPPLSPSLSLPPTGRGRGSVVVVPGWSQEETTDNAAAGETQVIKEAEVFASRTVATAGKLVTSQHTGATAKGRRRRQ